MQALRVMLVALVTLSGVASAFSNPPVTYTRAGAELIRRLSIMDPTVYQVVGNVYPNAATGNADISIPLNWTTPSNVTYNGNFNILYPDGTAFALDYFYQKYCQTAKETDCGRLKRPSGGNTGEAFTGTSLDKWIKQHNIRTVGLWAFPLSLDSVSQSTPPSGWPMQVDHICYVNNKQVEMKSGSVYLTHDGGLHYSPEHIGYSVQFTGGNYDNVYGAYGEQGPGFGSNGVAQSALNWLNYFCNDPSILDFKNGQYGSIDEPVSTHPDVQDGLPIVWAEVLADLDRTQGIASINPRGMHWDPVPTPEQTESPTPAGPPTPSSGGGTTGTSTSGGGPPCVRSDGSSSGNPYDCAPTDSELHCSIIDIPCNLRKLFIPRSSFLQDFFENGKIFAYLHLPTQPADSWTFELDGHQMTIVWSDYPLPEALHGMIKFLIFYAAFFWSLDVFGLPNPFRRTVGGLAADAIKKGLGRKR